MKNYFKLIPSIALAFFLSSAAHAQNEKPKNSMLSVHIGPSWQTGRLMGITDYADSYRSNLRKGITWDASYWFVGAGPRHEGVRIAPGILYQGSIYKGSHNTGSDKIQMHYMAPQFGVFFIKNQYQIQLAAGLGYQLYQNKSKVYDKPRDISMNRLAFNLSLSGEYFLSKEWGVSAQMNWVTSASERYRVEYHNQTFDVEYPKTGYGYFGQLSILFGLNYHF